MSITQTPWRRENFLLSGTNPGGQSRLHLERRKLNQSSHSFPLDLLPGGSALLFERMVSKRGSRGRFFQESWPIDFEGFPAAASAAANQEEASLGLWATHFPKIKRRRGDPKCTRTAVTTCQRREVHSHRAAGFSRVCERIKRRYALWNSDPRPERHGYKSLFAGGKLHRCQRFCSRIRCERSIHRKDFPGAVD